MKYTVLLLLSILIVSCGGDSSETNGETPEKDSVQVDSMKLYNEAVQKNPNSVDPLYARAGYYIRQGDIAAANLDLENAMQVDSTNTAVRTLYADVLMTNLNIEEGRRHYEYVIAQDSLNIGANMGMAKIYGLLNNTAMAIIHLNSVLAADQYYAEAYFMKGMFYRSDYYRFHPDNPKKQEAWDRAMSSYQTAVEQDPNYYSAYVEMGVMHDEAGSDLALDYYNSALDIYPESIEAWYNIGMYYQRRGKIDDALSSYRTLNGIDPTYADAYYNEGYIHLLMTEDLDSAVYYFEIAVDRDPEYFQAYNNLGLAYEKKGDLPNAKKYYQKAVDINPEFQLAKDNLNRLQ